MVVYVCTEAPNKKTKFDTIVNFISVYIALPHDEFDAIDLLSPSKKELHGEFGWVSSSEEHDWSKAFLGDIASL